jgi:hypothetical protein
MNAWKVSTVVLGGALAVVVAGSQIRTAQAEPQPHMRAALQQLEAAKDQLQKASHDKGGHRVKAIALTSEAIEQVKKGIEFDDKH